MESPTSPETELERLKRRIAEVEQEVSEHRRVAQQFEDRFRLLTAVTNEAVFVVANGIVLDVSRECEEIYGYRRDELIGQPVVVVVAPESREFVAHNVRTGYEGPFEAVQRRKDGSTFIARVLAKELEDEGKRLRVAAVVDITERKRAEETRRAALVQEEVIRAQAKSLDQLSTPLLPISEGVVVLPLIGAVSPTRAERVIETLTYGVFAHRAAVAILDITGTRDVGAEVADLLVRAAAAVQLLGARVIITGVRPEVAQVIVGLGKDLGGIVTHGTLQQGVAVALRRTAG